MGLNGINTQNRGHSSYAKMASIAYVNDTRGIVRNTRLCSRIDPRRSHAFPDCNAKEIKMIIKTLMLATAVTVGIGMAATSNASARDLQGETAVTPPASSSYQRSGRSAFFLPPPDPAEIRRCALPEAILNSASRSACGSVHHAGA
jgi:hypothetical protein